MLLVLLTHRQALSSHSQMVLFVMIFWESMNFHPDKELLQLPAPGIEQLTLESQVQRSPLHHGPGDSLVTTFISTHFGILIFMESFAKK